MGKITQKCYKQGAEQSCLCHLNHVEQATGKLLDLLKSGSLAPGKVKRSQFNTKFASISSQFNFLMFLNMKVKNVVSGSIIQLI